MATYTEKLFADASPQANLNNSINPSLSSSGGLDRFQDSAISPPSTVVSHSHYLMKVAHDSTSTKVSAVALETTAPVSDTEKKIRRAERFGITVQLSEQEKRNSRAERFGTPAGSGAGSTVNNSEELKRKARAERFGLPMTADEDLKKKARLERFAPISKTDAVEEDKKKARELRFSQHSKTLPMNGKGDIEPAAIAGKAGGGA